MKNIKELKKINKKQDYACCDESTRTCDTCTFEDSIKIEEE